MPSSAVQFNIAFQIKVDNTIAAVPEAIPLLLLGSGLVGLGAVAWKRRWRN